MKQIKKHFFNKSLLDSQQTKVDFIYLFLFRYSAVRNSEKLDLNLSELLYQQYLCFIQVQYIIFAVDNGRPQV